MKTLVHVLAGALVIGASLPALADEALPGNPPRMTSPGPYDEFTKQIQQKLTELGFYAGPVNGDFGPQTQAALAQYQQANLLPVSGMPDAPTLLDLDVLRSDTGAETSAAAGATRP